MEDTKWVTSIEEGTTTKNTPMWTITWYDGKSDKVFKEEWVDICETARRADLAIHYKKEQKGNYWNIVELDLVKDKLPDPKKPQEATIPGGAQSTKSPANSADSLNYRSALTHATEYVIAKINNGTEQNVNDVVIVAEVFLQYLEGNITPDVTKVISALNKK